MQLEFIEGRITVPEKFKAGDVVEFIIDGGPTMLVIVVSDGESSAKAKGLVECMWFGKDWTMQRGWFEPQMLKKRA
jgi:uncharacterized protein YodC (DUF2158 family)